MKRTAARTFVLRVRSPQRIFTKAEAARLRPKKGELISRGALTDQARAGSPSQTHVSVHILDRASGHAVWKPYPLRARLGQANGTPGRPAAVALMQGIGKDACDRHYGTNVRLEPGQRYRLNATLGTETVTFVFKAATHAGHGG